MNEQSTQPTKDQLEMQVREAIRAVVALRKLTKQTNMQTSKSQSSILKVLCPEVLAKVAIALAEIEEGGSK